MRILLILDTLQEDHISHISGSSYSHRWGEFLALQRSLRWQRIWSGIGSNWEFCSVKENGAGYFRETEPLSVRISGGSPVSFSIETGRLALEDITERDFPDIRRIARDREIMRYVLLWLEDDEQIDTYVQHAIKEAQNPDRKDFILAARSADTREFAGLTFIEIDRYLGSTAEVGIVLPPAYSRSRYGTEILNAYLQFGFEVLGMHRVYGKCDELNLASSRLMEKCGLTYEGTIREHVWLRDHWRSTRYYGMLAGEYRSGD